VVGVVRVVDLLERQAATLQLGDEPGRPLRVLVHDGYGPGNARRHGYYLISTGLGVLAHEAECLARGPEGSGGVSRCGAYRATAAAAPGERAPPARNWRAATRPALQVVRATSPGWTSLRMQATRGGWPPIALSVPSSQAAAVRPYSVERTGFARRQIGQHCQP